MICEIVISIALGYTYKMTNPENCDQMPPEYAESAGCLISISAFDGMPRRFSCLDRCGNPQVLYHRDSADTVRIFWAPKEECDR